MAVPAGAAGGLQLAADIGTVPAPGLAEELRQVNNQMSKAQDVSEIRRTLEGQADDLERLTATQESQADNLGRQADDLGRQTDDLGRQADDLARQLEAQELIVSGTAHLLRQLRAFTAHFGIQVPEE